MPTAPIHVRVAAVTDSWRWHPIPSRWLETVARNWGGHIVDLSVALEPHLVRGED